ATTKAPSATKRASTRRLAAVPSKRVVISLSARSSASARCTACSPKGSGSANREHPLDSASRAKRGVGRDRHVVFQVAERVAQVLQRDLLHVATFGRLVGRDEFLSGILAPQPMQHAGFRGHHEASGRGNTSASHHLLGRYDLHPPRRDLTLGLRVVHRARDTAALRVHEKLRVGVLDAPLLERLARKSSPHVALAEPYIERSARHFAQVIAEEEVGKEEYGNAG